MIMTGPALALVITGAPLTNRAVERVDAAAGRGWRTHVVTAASLAWLARR